MGRGPQINIPLSIHGRNNIWARTCYEVRSIGGIIFHYSKFRRQQSEHVMTLRQCFFYIKGPLCINMHGRINVNSIIGIQIGLLIRIRIMSIVTLSIPKRISMYIVALINCVALNSTMCTNWVLRLL